MKVLILKSNSRIKGDPGRIVECDPAIGNSASCVGLVKVIEHGPLKPGQKVSTLKNQSAPKPKVESEE